MATRLPGRYRDVIGMGCMVSRFPHTSAARDGADAPLNETPDGRALTLVFADDFQTFRPWNGRSGVWSTTLGDSALFGLGDHLLPANGDHRLHLDKVAKASDPFSIDEGVFCITAEPAPAALERGPANYPYMSGLISTQPSFAQTYGYFEMRAELPEGKGLWPAFWMLPQDESWPPEIDIVESIGDPGHVYMTAHSKVDKFDGIEARITPNAFHTFAVSWDARHLIWYIDGLARGQQRTPRDMHKPMYMLANLAVGGNWPGAPDATTPFPAKLTIDYIRAYRFAS